ncbi:MAG TPA: helix-turn-helix domain-containing protein, partial [Azospirillum sp.]
LYHWPGNVRQLQNVVRNIVVLHEGEVVSAAMLPPPLAPQSAPASAPAAPAAAAPPGRREIKPLWLVEKEALEDAIAACDGNIPRAAALLDISASTIYRKRLAWEAEGKL